MPSGTSAVEKEQIGKLAEDKNAGCKSRTVDSESRERISMPITMAGTRSRSHAHGRQKSSRIKRPRDGNARLLRRPALKVPFTYRAKKRRGWEVGEKKMRTRFARRRLRGGKNDGNRGSGGRKGGGGGRWRSKSRKGKFRYCLRQPRGTRVPGAPLK